MLEVEGRGRVDCMEGGLLGAEGRRGGGMLDIEGRCPAMLEIEGRSDIEGRSAGMEGRRGAGSRLVEAGGLGGPW
jgi:hypothetical protein